MTQTALVTGITGQDGAYLARHLIERDTEVVGCYRRTSSDQFWRLRKLGIENHPLLKKVEFDLLDQGNAIRLLQGHEPTHVYNLAAQSFVGVSFEQPIMTGHTTGLGCLNLLEAIRIVNPATRFYQASTSEMFGQVQAVPQSETTPFYPRSPYGVAKLFAHWSTINYRESYGIFASSGILFNHESPLRGIEFVTRKIAAGVARIRSGSDEPLALGNLDAKRDWGYAGDYVEGMYLMLQQEQPDTFVLATGQTISVRDFVRLAFESANMDIEFEGSGVKEIAVDKRTGQTVVNVSPHFFRPAEVDLLIGDPSKAKDHLGWEAKTSIQKLVEMMVESEIDNLEH